MVKLVAEYSLGHQDIPTTLQFVLGDITELAVDCVVTSALPDLMVRFF
jgi:hypothetical protein